MKKIYLILIVLLLIMTPLVSAFFQFDNIKGDLIINKDTSEYGKIEIRNSVFGLEWFQLDKVMSLELKENTELCPTEGCSANTEIIMYEDGKLIDAVRFIDLETRKETNIRSYEIYVNGDLYNGEEVSGYSSGVKYDVEIRGSLFVFQEVDWQIKSANTDWIEDWAVWTDSLTNGTVAYYKLDEIAGTNAEDSVGGYDLTTRAVNWTTGILDNGLSFIPSNSTNFAWNESIMRTNQTDFTISFWFKLDHWFNATYTSMTGLWTGPAYTADDRADLFLDSNKGAITFSYEGQGETHVNLDTPTTHWDEGVWYHIVARWSVTDSNVSLWKNGVVEHSDATTKGYHITEPTTNNFSVGWASALKSTNGTIDEFGYWNRSLTDAEIVQLYNSGTGITIIAEGTPEVTLNSPADDYTTVNKTMTFNCSATVTEEYNLTNISLYHNASGVWTLNQTNSTLENGNYTSTVFSTDFDFGSYEWNCYACANSSLCSYGTNSSFNIEKFSIDNENYSQVTTEGNVETFYINITTADLGIDSANFTYNSTDYAAEFTQDGYAFEVSKTITIPQVSTSKNLTFNWTFELSDASVTSSTSHNQSVLSLNMDNCSTYNYTLFNISLRDEDDQSELAGGAQNTSIKLDFTISTSSGTEMINYSTFFNLTNPAAVCLESELNQSSLRLDGIIEYSSSGRFTEFYHFQNYSLDETTTDINISLYNLNSSQGQEFKITYKDSNFVPIEGAIMDIQRKYVDEGVFKTTERPKTGTEGYTIGHLVINDVIYNIIVYKEGVILASFNDIVADCQNPALSSCTINLNSYGSSVLPESFATANDISFTLTYNKSTREIDSVFTILSGATSSINLDVNLFDSLGSTQVCNDTTYASGGAVSCTVPLGFGNSTVIAKLNKNGDLIGQSVIRITPDPSDIYGNNLIYIALIAFITLIGIGITNDPMTMGISLIIGIIVLTGLNLIYTPAIVNVGATILWFIIAVVIILIKGSSRQ